MLIMGVDPGTVATGYGIVRKNNPSPLFVAGGVIRPGTKKVQAEKLLSIHAGLDKIIREFQPSVMVVESLFHAVNSQSLIKLGQVRGVILLLGALHGMDVFEYSPLEIKRGITGYGHADKSQVMFMIQKILHVPPLKSFDQADALAMATYHAHSRLPQKVAK
ncbi:MAG: crossover junction endodeoxyribonuclease RuvC [Deltaproteobacteria bacterium]|nr:crossover junction endodeoxyribonuclease RuvC [Deltaproteobacteria bacterium]